MIYDEPLDCWDDYPMEHGCICGNDCEPPAWMVAAPAPSPQTPEQGAGK